jgi:hypothetical protein
MVCPQCQGAFEQRLQCPNCNVRLVYKGPKAALDITNKNANLLQTPWGRMLLGLLLSQGLYFGLRKLCLAGLMAFGESLQSQVMTALYGLILLQVLQLVGLIVGATVTGAGQKLGFVLGGVVGLLNGILSFMFQENASHTANLAALFGMPLVHTAFGAIAGHIGSTIWKPLAPPEEPKAAITFDRKVLGPAMNHPATFSGPVAWLRVAFGAGFAICGTLFAKKILDNVVDVSEGKLTTDSYIQAELITWEIRALAILIGSALAGCGTINSLKQGFVVGLAVSAVHLFGAISGNALPMDQAILTVGCALGLGIVGGWFGGQLFPAYVPALRLRAGGPGSIGGMD